MYPRSYIFPALLAAALTSLAPLASAGPVQPPNMVKPFLHHRDDVQALFEKSFATYRRYAYGHDALAPITRGFSDTRNGWGATIIDAMSTMFIMGLNDTFDEAVNFASNMDFSYSKTRTPVSVFKSTIRYIGGLLSAYELSGQRNSELLDRARQLADKLAFAWVGDNDIPYSHLNFRTNEPYQRNSNIAHAGTLAIEWSRLSSFTGNATYRDLAEKALRHIANSAGPLPGLPAQGLDPSDGTPLGDYVTWGRGSGSYFEYLIKYSQLTNASDPIFVNAWKTAVDSSIKYLLKTSTVGGHLYLGDYQPDKGVISISSQAACFHGGNWIYGGKLLDNETIFEYGIQLNDACWNTYASTATGLGPRTFRFQSTDGPSSGEPEISEADQAFYDKNGFYITSAGYYMSSEVVESNFYAWRATGETIYLDRAAFIIDSISKYLAVNDAFAPITDVNSLNSTKRNVLESCWFGEILKYLYLTFDDPLRYSLDEYVFNAQGHPFKAPAAKESLGSYSTGAANS